MFDQLCLDLVTVVWTLVAHMFVGLVLIRQWLSW